MDYEIRLLDFNDGDASLQKIASLQNIVYEGTHTFGIEGFRKWYLQNPMGKVISFNAFYGEELVAHYACVPYKMEIEGRIVTGLFDIATATHPNHRGKGLFKNLAKTTYEYAQKQGYEFVIGVANANSFPGYMKHFPFTFIGQLNVKMGLGSKITCGENKMFKVYWDNNSFNWRLRCCKANYSKGKGCVVGKYNSYVQTFMGAFDDSFLSQTAVSDKGWGWRPKLYVGMGAKFKSWYFKVPKFIKRSPFNLIFLDLTDGKLPVPNKDNFFFQLFDLDLA